MLEFISWLVSSVLHASLSSDSSGEDSLSDEVHGYQVNADALSSPPTGSRTLADTPPSTVAAANLRGVSIPYSRGGTRKNACELALSNLWQAAVLPCESPMPAEDYSDEDDSGAHVMKKDAPSLPGCHISPHKTALVTSYLESVEPAALELCSDSSIDESASELCDSSPLPSISQRESETMQATSTDAMSDLHKSWLHKIDHVDTFAPEHVTPLDLTDPVAMQSVMTFGTSDNTGLISIESTPTLLPPMASVVVKQMHGSSDVPTSFVKDSAPGHQNCFVDGETLIKAGDSHSTTPMHLSQFIGADGAAEQDDRSHPLPTYVQKLRQRFAKALN